MNASTYQDKVLAAIMDHWRKFAIPPTIRAVQLETGINSTSLIRSYYFSLAEQGAIAVIKSKPVPVQIYKLLTTGESSQ